MWNEYWNLGSWTLCYVSIDRPMLCRATEPLYMVTMPNPPIMNTANFMCTYIMYIKSVDIASLQVWLRTGQTRITGYIYRMQVAHIYFAVSPHRSFSPTKGLLDYTVQVSALAFSYPLLFVGTSSGHLSVFRTAEEPPVSRLRRGSVPTLCDSRPHTFSLPVQTLSQRTRSSPGYKLLGATHCGPYSVVSIYVVPAIGQIELLRSPFWSPINSPGSGTVVVVVVCGPKSREGEDTVPNSISVSQVQMYELVSTPSHSPASTPDGSISPSCISPRRRSITYCYDNSAPTGTNSPPAPPLSMVSAAPTSLSLLPLDERT